MKPGDQHGGLRLHRIHYCGSLIQGFAHGIPNGSNHVRILIDSGTMGQSLDPYPAVTQKTETHPQTGKALSKFVGHLGRGNPKFFMLQSGGNQIDKIDQLLLSRRTMQLNHGFEPLRPGLDLLHRCLLHRLRAMGHLNGDNPEQLAA